MIRHMCRLAGRDQYQAIGFCEVKYIFYYDGPLGILTNLSRFWFSNMCAQKRQINIYSFTT